MWDKTQYMPIPLWYFGIFIRQNHIIILSQKMIEFIEINGNMYVL